MADAAIQNPQLAINGGKPAIAGPLARYNSIGFAEADAAFNTCLGGPLSGYLGGELQGGYHVESLEAEWCKTFNVKHAVACNSATSGLLMACHAAGVGFQTRVATSCFTMSGTIAPAVLLGANIEFCDIEKDYFCLEAATWAPWVIAPNIFGHPFNRRSCPPSSLIIEDNAQAIYAKDGDRYAGTIGTMGVWSLNIHKQIQAGEGGIVTTDVDELAYKLRLFRNHGELANSCIGLNLRMTEVTAAIAMVQLKKAHKLVAERIEIAEQILEAIGDIPGITLPEIRQGCTHSFYVIAFKTTLDRKRLVEALNAEGFPIKAGYVDPLYRLPAFRKFKAECRVAERMHDRELMLYENCGYTPTMKQIKQMGTAFKKVAEHANQ